MTEDIAEVDETIQNSEILWTDGRSQVVFPQERGFPISEGEHLQVTLPDKSSWCDMPIKDLLRLFYFSLPVAKVVAEGMMPPDMWANIHTNRQPYDGGVNVFGRFPSSSDSWGKPVRLHKEQQGEAKADPTVPETLTQYWKRILAHYMPMWSKEFENVSLFEDGVQSIDQESKEFKTEFERYKARNEHMIWINNKFVAVIIEKPHLTGAHFVVHPRESYWKERGMFKRAWQADHEHIIGFLEAEAIAITLERLLRTHDDLQVHNPELHCSGNWAKDLMERLDRVASVLTPESRKQEKRKHKPDAEEAWATAMHIHLYGSNEPTIPVTLPSRPQSEVPKEWEGIEPPDLKKVQKITEVVQAQLTQQLKLCTGLVTP